MLILIDNLDSFTYNITSALEALYSPLVVLDNKIENFQKIIDLNPAGIVIGPGPFSPKDSTLSMQILKRFSSKKIPILGICLGHQCIGEYFGAIVDRKEHPAHGVATTIKQTNTHVNCPILSNIPSTFNATRYHSLVIKNPLPVPLIQILESDNDVMGIMHKELPIYGVQFHPEAYFSEYGKEIFQNFIKLIKLIKTDSAKTPDPNATNSFNQTFPKEGLLVHH